MTAETVFDSKRVLGNLINESRLLFQDRNPYVVDYASVRLIVALFYMIAASFLKCLIPVFFINFQIDLVVWTESEKGNQLIMKSKRPTRWNQVLEISQNLPNANNL